MDLTHEFAAIVKEFGEFREMLEQTRTQRLAPDMRAYLEDVIHALDEQFAEVQKGFPEAVKEIDHLRAAARATNEQTFQDLAALEKERAAMEKAEGDAADAARAAAAAGPGSPTPVTIDAQLGGRLRSELLSQYGLKPQAAPAAPQDLGSVWQIASQLEVAEPAAGPAPPEQPTPKKQPPATDSDSLGSLSDLDDK